MRTPCSWLTRTAPALIALALAGCSNRAAQETASVGTAADTTIASRFAPPVIPIGAEELLARAQDGRGATLVNLWATWCAPCRHEFPALLNVARAHKGDGLRLMLVSTDFDDQLPAVRRFLASHGVGDTTYLKTGDDNTFINTVHRDWSGALPATLVFDKNGNLTDFWEGAADENRFEHAVIAALAETPQTEVPK